MPHVLQKQGALRLLIKQRSYLFHLPSLLDNTLFYLQRECSNST